MHATSRTRLSVFLVCFLTLTLQGVAQEVITSLHTGGFPATVAVNPITNKIYVVNSCGNDPTCTTHYGTVTVLDGKSLSTATVAVGIRPDAVAINSITNKIYVSNLCGYDPTCLTSNETITTIDGATLSTATQSVGFSSRSFLPNSIAVNPVTNEIYAMADCGSDPSCQTSGTVTVIDGTTNLIKTTIPVGSGPSMLAVNRVTNEIYVVNSGSNNVTVIDGASNTVVLPPVQVGITPIALTIDEITNQIYVSNSGSNNVTVIDAVNNNNTFIDVPVQSNPRALSVNPVTNRIYVVNAGSDSVTVINGDNNQTLPPVQIGDSGFVSTIGVDAVTNKVYVTNELSNTVTVIDGVSNSTVTVSVPYDPIGIAINSLANRIYVVNDCGDAGCDIYDGSVTVIAGAESNALQFIAVTPCRIVDTRNPPGQFGGPSIQGQTSRSFPLPLGNCGTFPGAAAYSLNVTVVPNGPLGYLSIWPTGEDQPIVSTMNSLDGRIKANAAIVPAGYQGAISVYVTNTTNVVLDIDGYFAPVSGSTLAFYPLTPCRVLDTRNPNGPLGGPDLQGGQLRDFPILAATVCNIGSNATAYSLNFTAVPKNRQPLGYLTVWPTGQPQPLVSTLNDLTGTILANAALVSVGAGGDIDVYASDETDLIADINGYFAPANGNFGGLSLYPAAPCRVIDTRQSGGAFSGQLNPAVDVVNSSCGVPSTAEGYVFSATVVPQGPLGYITLWPDGQNQPLVSTLNAIDGAVTSNMAILQNYDGETNAYASGMTQLILDISSYFAP